jgi:hypothetical protein
MFELGEKHNTNLRKPELTIGLFWGTKSSIFSGASRRELDIPGSYLGNIFYLKH